MKKRILKGIFCLILVWILLGIPALGHAVQSSEVISPPTNGDIPVCSTPSIKVDSAEASVLPHVASGQDLVDAMTLAQTNGLADPNITSSNPKEKYMTLRTASGQTLVAPMSCSTANLLTLNTSTTLFFNDIRGGDKVDILLQNYTFLSKEYIREGSVRVIALLGTESLISDVFELRPIEETEINSVSQELDLLGGNILSTDTSLPFMVAEMPYDRIFEFAQRDFVVHIFLDKKNTVQLSESVPLIKPPTEWTQIEQGFGFKINGSGIKIAILDTGIDKNHPDLNDLDDNPSTYDPKVIDEMCFTGENHVWDGFGHGTHCASIAAGTGEASNHTRVGVAPAALLLNAKVLTDGGSGLDSWIISGIEWAITKSANILSMSFGSSANGDGSDPLSMAIDWATDKGLVCAVAAGNAGTGGMSTLGTPAVSKKAITVGATTKTDEIAYFSSQGPTLDYRLKPDVCAPGVDIVAARANGTSMGNLVDAYYTMASGTSMATPHVAGAAALVIQAHHDWNSIMIKSSLMGNAKTLSGEHLWREGAGRIDVCKATNATLLFVSPSVSFGILKLGNIAKTTLTLMNLASTSAAITVSEVAFCEGLEVNYASVNASSIVIPSRSNATVALQAGPLDSLAPDGWYEGRINATRSSGPSTKMPFLFALFSEIAVSVYDVNNLTPIDASIALATYPDLTFTNYGSASWTNSAGSWTYKAANLLSKSGNQSLSAQMAWIQNGPNIDFARMFMLQKIINVPKGAATNISISLGDAKISYIPTLDSAGNNLIVHSFAQYFSGGVQTWNGYFYQSSWSMGSIWSGRDLNVSQLMFYSTNYAPADRLCEALGYYATDALLSEVYLMPLKYWNVPSLPLTLSYPKSDLAKYNVFYDMPETYPENGIDVMDAFWFTWDHIGGAQFWGWDVHRVCAGINATFYLAPGNGTYFGDYMTTYAGWNDYIRAPAEEWQIGRSSPYPQIPPQKGERGSMVLGNFSFAPYQPGLNLNVSKTGGGFSLNLTGDIWKNLSWPNLEGKMLFGLPGSPSFYPQDYAQYKLYVNQSLYDQGNLNGNKGYNGEPYINYPPNYLDVDWRGISKTWNISSSKILLQLSLPSLATISRNTMYNLSFTLGSSDSTPPMLTGITYPLNYAPGQNLAVNFTAMDIGLGISSHSLKYSFDNGTTWKSATYQGTNYLIPCEQADFLAILVNVTDKAGNSLQYLTAPASLCSKVNLSAPTKLSAPGQGAGLVLTGSLTTVEGNCLGGVAVLVSNDRIRYTIPDKSGTFVFIFPATEIPESCKITSPSTGLYNSEQVKTEIDFRLAWTRNNLISGTPENDVHPAMATDSRDFLYAAFEHFNATSRFYEIYISKSTDHGKTWSIIENAADYTHNLGYPSITIDVGDNNNLFVAFEREWTLNDHDIFVLRFVGGSWSISTVANAAGNDDRYPSITCEYQYGTTDQQFISYEYVYNYDDRDIMFAKSVNDGGSWSLQKLHGNWPDYNVHCQSSITTNRGSDGLDYIYIAYKWGADYNTAYDIVIDKSKNRGTTWTQQWVCDETARDKNWPSITATHGSGALVVAWHVYFDSTYLNDVQYAFSTNNGNSWTVAWLAFEANASEESPMVTADGKDSINTVVNGNFHVAYWKGGKICYKKAAFDNPSLWTQIESPTDTTAIVPSTYNKPAITTYKDANGPYLPVVAWTDIRGTSYDIYSSSKAIQRNLSVVSSHDSPNPSAGDHLYFDGDSVTCNVSSPVTENSVVWSCSGWTGTGSVPPNGIGTSATFTLTQDSSITWNWQSSQTSFQDGFESGNFNAWSGTSFSAGETGSVTNTRLHHGIYSARFTSNGGGGYENASCLENVAPAAEIYVRGYFYVSQSGIADNLDRIFFIKLRNQSEGLAWAGWKRTGGVTKWCLTIRNGTSFVDVFATSRPSTGRWYCVELHWKKDAKGGTGQIWVDGSLVCSTTTMNTATYGNADKVQFGLAEIYGCTATTVYGDCAKIATTYIGPEPAISSFTVSPTPFSPNGDGTKDTTTITAKFNVIVNWNILAKNSSGSIIRNWSGTGSTLSLVWDGKDTLGNRVTDGTYNFTLAGMDSAGIQFTPQTKQVVVDTKIPTVTSITVSPSSFSPRLSQSTTIRYTLSESCYVTVQVYNSANTLIRTLVNNASQSSGARSTTWNGKTSSGTAVPAGTYTIKISVTDKAGNKAVPYPITQTVAVT